MITRTHKTCAISQSTCLAPMGAAMHLHPWGEGSTLWFAGCLRWYSLTCAWSAWATLWWTISVMCFSTSTQSDCSWQATSDYNCRSAHNTCTWHQGLYIISGIPFQLWTMLAAYSSPVPCTKLGISSEVYSEALMCAKSWGLYLHFQSSQQTCSMRILHNMYSSERVCHTQSVYTFRNA